MTGFVLTNANAVFCSNSRIVGTFGPKYSTAIASSVGVNEYSKRLWNVKQFSQHIAPLDYDHYLQCLPIKNQKVIKSVPKGHFIIERQRIVGNIGVIVMATDQVA